MASSLASRLLIQLKSEKSLREKQSQHIKEPESQINESESRMN